MFKTCLAVLWSRECTFNRLVERRVTEMRKWWAVDLYRSSIAFAIHSLDLS